MDILLTRGLRHADPGRTEDWPELVTRVIQGKWPAPAPLPQTLEAERGLGILGRPYYFYVLRAEEAFGLIVVVLREAEHVVWPTDVKGATPFDSGGWWHEFVRIKPPLDTTARQAAFQTLDVPLRDWQDAFEQYIEVRYGTIDDYLEGRAPDRESQPSKAGFTIIGKPPKAARAWTWEVRVPHDLIAGRLTLVAVYMAESSQADYIDWLFYHSPFTDSESSQLHQRFLAHVRISERKEMVVRAVRKLMWEAAHG